MFGHSMGCILQLKVLRVCVCVCLQHECFFTHPILVYKRHIILPVQLCVEKEDCVCVF